MIELNKDINNLKEKVKNVQKVIIIITEIVINFEQTTKINKREKY